MSTTDVTTALAVLTTMLLLPPAAPLLSVGGLLLAPPAKPAGGVAWYLRRATSTVLLLEAVYAGATVLNARATVRAAACVDRGACWASSQSLRDDCGRSITSRTIPSAKLRQIRLLPNRCRDQEWLAVHGPAKQRTGMKKDVVGLRFGLTTHHIMFVPI